MLPLAPVRVLALDLGTARVGVAVSDATGTLASPRGHLARSGDTSTDRRAIASVTATEEADRVLVGLPLSLDGGDGPAATSARAEAAALADELGEGVEVELVDERFTTISAQARLAESGVRGRRQRDVVDSAAAAIMLQAWLDARAAGTPTASTSRPPGAIRQ